MTPLVLLVAMDDADRLPLPSDSSGRLPPTPLKKAYLIYLLRISEKNHYYLTQNSHLKCLKLHFVSGHMLLVAKEIALARGLDRTGYHVMVDEQHNTKTLKSLHVFGRALHHMLWPVGPGCRL